MDSNTAASASEAIAEAYPPNVKLEECRVLRIQPGDIVVFETEERIRREDVDLIRGQLNVLLAEAGHEGIPTMVISGGHLVTARAERPTELARAVSREQQVQAARR